MNAAEVTVLQQPPTPLEFAKSMAQSEQSSILLVSGPIPMDSGYPARDHANIIQIATIIAHGRRKIGLYRILQRQELHYRIYVITQVLRHCITFSIGNICARRTV